MTDKLFMCAVHTEPGHRVVQAIFWTLWPSQKAPPLSGAGLVQVLVRFWKPLPQRLLHTDHSVQVDQPPFTAKQEKKSMVTQTAQPRQPQGASDSVMRPRTVATRHGTRNSTEQAQTHVSSTPSARQKSLYKLKKC